MISFCSDLGWNNMISVLSWFILINCRVIQFTLYWNLSENVFLPLSHLQMLWIWNHWPWIFWAGTSRRCSKIWVLKLSLAVSRTWSEDSGNTVHWFSLAAFDLIKRICTISELFQLDQFLRVISLSDQYLFCRTVRSNQEDHHCTFAFVKPMKLLISEELGCGKVVDLHVSVDSFLRYAFYQFAEEWC